MCCIVVIRIRFLLFLFFPVVVIRLAQIVIREVRCDEVKFAWREDPLHQNVHFLVQAPLIVLGARLKEEVRESSDELEKFNEA